MVFKCDGNLAVMLWAQWQSGQLDCDLHLERIKDDPKGQLVAYVRAISPGALNEWLAMYAKPAD